MRQDLNKLLCERERVGHSKKYREARRNKKFANFGEEGELLPSNEGMKYRHTRGYGDTKSFNENLSPLWGLIRKNVGRPYDKFYSELCQVFDKRSVINQHILQHLDDFLVKTLYLVDGELWVRGTYRQDEKLKGSWVEYYVDPRDGIIKKNKHYRTWKQDSRGRRAKAEAERNARFVQIDANNVLRFIDGVWFHFELKKVPKGRYVYEKPLDKEIFKTHMGRMRYWDQLTDFDKEKYGVKRFEGESAVDVYTNERVYSTGRRRLRAWSENNEVNIPSDMYHATKRTASHKMLKQAGVI